MTGIPSRMLTFLSHQYPYSLPHSPCQPTHELFLKRSTKLQAKGRDTQTPVRIRVVCSRHATGKSPPSSTLLLPLLLRSLDSGPSIAQGDRTVEDKAICCGINGIDTEVAEPLELIPTPRSGAR
jgi:hypothetical protein